MCYIIMYISNIKHKVSILKCLKILKQDKYLIPQNNRFGYTHLLKNNLNENYFKIRCLHVVNHENPLCEDVAIGQVI